MVLVLNPAKFNRLLGVDRPGLGQHMTWEKSLRCPCRSPTSGAAEQGCPVCRGKGVVWEVPIAAWASLSGMKLTRQWAMYGQFEAGDTVVTIPSDSPLYAVGESDVVTFIDSTEPFSTIVMGGVDVLTFQAATITKIVWRDPTTKALISGQIPVQGADGVLTWTAGAPPAGVQYSVTGRRHPKYWCFQDMPQDRAHSAGLTLPRRVVLRTFDLFGK